MKCQSLYAGKNKKNIINVLSVEFVHNTVSVNTLFTDDNFPERKSFVCLVLWCANMEICLVYHPWMKLADIHSSR